MCGGTINGLVADKIKLMTLKNSMKMTFQIMRTAPVSVLYQRHRTLSFLALWAQALVYTPEQGLVHVSQTSEQGLVQAWNSVRFTCARPQNRVWSRPGTVSGSHEPDLRTGSGPGPEQCQVYMRQTSEQGLVQARNSVRFL